VSLIHSFNQFQIERKKQQNAGYADKCQESAKQIESEGRITAKRPLYESENLAEVPAVKTAEIRNLKPL
jgi:hypothetical protein